MPASTMDPVNAALRTSLSKTGYTSNLDSQLAGSTKKALLANIDFEAVECYQSSVLDKLKSKYIVLESVESLGSSNEKQDATKGHNASADDGLSAAKRELYPLNSVQLGWNSNANWFVGTGMVNMGNTCYLNSTLQALFHVPALVNWLMADKQHVAVCESLGGTLCVICAMRKTLQDSQQRHVNAIRPYLIYNKLRVLCRNLLPGRQEDAHEFLRYLVEAMEKAYLNRFKNHAEFDSRTKETTPLNQILGGYLRSTVRCLECGHISTTFQHFQDLLLDIRKAQTLNEALDLYFSREKLDDESYHCESCQKKVPASKQFSLERAPMVICIQLKRFSITNNKIAKPVQFRQRLDLTKYMRKRPGNPLVYRLVALVTHMGPTVNCGHYTAIAQAPCGNFYQFDDSMVKPISHQAVFGTNAYIMLYELESSPLSPTVNGKLKTTLPISTITKQPLDESNGTGPVAINGSAKGKIYGPVLPPAVREDANSVPALHNGENVYANGNGINEATTTSSSSSSSESEAEQSTTAKGSSQNENKPSGSTATTHALPTSTTNTNGKQASNAAKSPLKSHNGNTQKNGVTAMVEPKLFSPDVTSSCESSSKQKGTKGVVHVRTKLVPYEMDDSSSCSEESPNANSACATMDMPCIAANATVGEWNVSSSTDVNRDKKRNGNDTVNELLQMSHDGYAGPVAAWNGTKSQLSQEMSGQKRDDRKRPMSDNANNNNQGRMMKHPKLSANGALNPGYNPIQEFHNSKIQNQASNNNNSHYRHFYNTTRHRNDRRLYNQKNYHKNYRFRQ